MTALEVAEIVLALLPESEEGVEALTADIARRNGVPTADVSAELARINEERHRAYQQQRADVDAAVARSAEFVAAHPTPCDYETQWDSRW